MWKARRKYRLLYFMLVTQLRDQVPAVCNALNLFVWAMRRLEGQVYSYDVAVSPEMNILPGSRAVHIAGLDQAEVDLKLGLSLLEGCFPVSHLNPGLKHFVHCPEFTRSHSILRILWMMAFER